MFDAIHIHQATQLLECYRTKGLKIAAAESCTGGLLMALLTAVPGSSDVVERGFVTYSNDAKIELLDVAAALVERFGAVSEPVAKGMAEGALWHSRADVSVAITGIAGPGGGSDEKPVGLVHIATGRREGSMYHETNQFTGDRDAVRLAAVVRALELLEQRLA